MHEAHGFERDICNMYISTMLHDRRFNGDGHIMSTSYGLANQGHVPPPEGGVSVMKAVDLLRLLIIGDVGGVYAAAALRCVARRMTARNCRYVDTDYEALQAIDAHIMQSRAFVAEEDEVI